MNAIRSTSARSLSLSLAGLLLLAAFSAAPSSTCAQTLARFEFSNELSSVDNDPHSDATLTKLGIGIVSPGLGNPGGVLIARTLYRTAGEARANEQVFRFTITPHSGYTVSMSSIFFDLAASKPNNATEDQVSQVILLTSRDGDTSPLIFAFSIDSTADGAHNAYVTWGNDLLGGNPLFQNIAEPTTISLYFFGSNQDGAAFLDNLTVNGVSTVAVPEPSTVALLALGVFALLGCAARNRAGSL